MGIIINGQNDTIGPVDNSMSLLGTVSIGGTMTIEDFTNIDSVGLITARNGLNVTGGNVKIGTTTEGAANADNFTVADSGNCGITIRSGTSSNGNIYFSDATSGSGEYAGYIQYRHGDNAIAFGDSSAERLRIHSDGKFSFGTATASAAKYTFNSAGTNEVARFESTDTGAYLAIKDSSSTSINFVEGGGDVLSLGVNSVERLRITTSGVGINDSTPDNTLSIKGLGSFDADSNSFYFGSNFTGTGQNYIGSSKHAQRFFLNNASANGYFSYSNTGSAGTAGDAITWQERLRITSAGNVGIKNTSPNNTLTVGDTVQASYAPSSAGNYIEIARTSGADAGLLINKNTGQWLVGIDNTDGANAPLRFEYGAAGSAHPGLGSANPAMMIKHDGRMGLGTNNPYHELHIQGSGDTRALITSGGTGDAVMMFENASGNTWGHGIDLTNNNYVIAYNNTSDPSLTADGKVEITTAGRLGVGLESPNSNLHIKGGSDSTDNLLLTLQSNGVASDGSLSTGLRLINSTANTSIHGAEIRAIRTGSTSSDLTFSLYDGSASQIERLRITSDGNMGLGVSPVYSGVFGGSQRVLHIGGTTAPGLRIQSSTSNQGDFIIQAGNSGGATYLSNLSNNADTVFYTTSGGSIGERLRINATGPISANPNSGDGDDFAATALKRDWNSWADIFYEGWIGGNNGWGTFWAGSTGAAYRRVSSDGNPNEYVFIGAGSKRFTFDLDVGGNAYFDGSLSQNNYDYAEYFEWEDGNPNNEDRRGYSVFLNANGKIEKATSGTSTSDIIGVISGTAAIIGDAAVYDWQGRYEIDEWGTRRKEQVTQVSWTDIDGTKHSYADENDIPSDVVVPDDASRRIHHRYIESSTYDSSQAYVPRDQRGEWGIVGLLGKVRVRNDSPKHPNWKYIKTIAGKDLWLIK